MSSIPSDGRIFRTRLFDRERKMAWWSESTTFSRLSKRISFRIQRFNKSTLGPRFQNRVSNVLLLPKFVLMRNELPLSDKKRDHIRCVNTHLLECKELETAYRNKIIPTRPDRTPTPDQTTPRRLEPSPSVSSPQDQSLPDRPAEESGVIRV